MSTSKIKQDLILDTIRHPLIAVQPGYAHNNKRDNIAYHALIIYISIHINRNEIAMELAILPPTPLFGPVPPSVRPAAIQINN